MLNKPQRWILWLAIGLGLSAPAHPADEREIVIGTGSQAGVYYHVGRALCHLLERGKAELRCTALESAGSLFNLSAVRDGAIEFGIAQADAQYHAVHGSGPFRFAHGNYDVVRALFSVHGEPFTLVARRDAGITKLSDLRGKRVNIGNPGSGQRATMEAVMDAMGWTKSDFQLATELPADQQSLALCHNRVQAMVYTVGHPNASVGKALELCDAVLVDVDEPQIAELVRERPYFSVETIPAGTYPGQQRAAKTFGVRATVVSSADVEPWVVEALLDAAFANLERLRRMHPALNELSASEMRSVGLSAPLHEAAQRYYREHALR